MSDRDAEGAPQWELVECPDGGTPSEELDDHLVQLPQLRQHGDRLMRYDCHDASNDVATLVLTDPLYDDRLGDGVVSETPPDGALGMSQRGDMLPADAPNEPDRDVDGLMETFETVEAGDTLKLGIAVQLDGEFTGGTMYPEVMSVFAETCVSLSLINLVLAACGDVCFRLMPVYLSGRTPIFGIIRRSEESSDGEAKDSNPST